MKSLKACALVIIALLMSGPVLGEVVTNAEFPFTLSVFVPCAAGGAGEVISMSGNLHVLFSVTVNGNNVHFQSHFQPQGISGVGLTTGEKYQATGVTRFDTNADVVDFPLNFTFVNNFRMIGQGPGNNLLVHENLHVTINADGTVTAFHDNFSVECK